MITGDKNYIETGFSKKWVEVVNEERGAMLKILREEKKKAAKAKKNKECEGEFMQRMDLLLEKTPAVDVKTDVLTMVYRALESNVIHIQELCLRTIPNFAYLFDSQSLKSALLPKIRTLCTSNTLLSVRVNSLICCHNPNSTSTQLKSWV